MTTVLIIGAGSIGNHLAYACRKKNWNIDIVDIDEEALIRMENEIYPSRYGVWDNSISLHSSIPQKKKWDIVIVGTPPDTHTKIALEVLEKSPPKVLLIEKPLTTPTMPDQNKLTDLIDKSGTKCLVGFNHNVTENTKFIEELITEGIVGNPSSINVNWLEDWSGIFKAHPWLSGPSDSYLGFQHLGGGACCEHSHAIALWLYLAKLLDAGSIVELNGAMKLVNYEGCDYDEETTITLTTSRGIKGIIKQDVKTMPAQKMARIDGDKGYIEWYANYSEGQDVVKWSIANGEEKMKIFPKSRPDDFKNEIDLIEELILNDNISTPLDYELGLEAAILTNKAVESNKLMKAIKL